MYDERLQQAINDKTDPVFLEKRSAIVDHYQDTYGANWKTHIVNDILRLDPTAKKASIQRQFQYDSRTGQERYKGEKVTASTRERYESLGKELPPVGRKLQGDSITITVKGEQALGEKHGGGTRDREIEVTLTGANAQEFINNPDYRSIWDEYGVDPDLFDKGDYAIAISSVY